ncbi:MAG: hypothetical protein WC488_05190 [Candidatus Micrarchaeia archaeon]
MAETEKVQLPARSDQRDKLGSKDFRGKVQRIFNLPYPPDSHPDLLDVFISDIERRYEELEKRGS